MEFDLSKQDMSIEEVLKVAQPMDSIYLADKTYYEKIVVTTPNLRIVGKKHSKISYCASHHDIIPPSLGGDGKKIFGTTGSATVRIAPSAFGFQAIGVTFENSYQRTDREQSQAVAFKSEADHVFLEDCTFLSHQDTLYLDYGKENILKNCYISGDIDFIFGSADATFIHCHIHACGDEKRIAYYTAPDTYEDNVEGFIFQNCRFTKDAGMEVYMGRPWFPSLALKKVYPRIHFIACEIPQDVHLCLKKMHEEDPTNYSFWIENCRMV